MTVPKLDPKDFELTHITDDELVQFTRLQNSDAWKGHLSSKDYVIREHVLGKSKIMSSDVNRLLVFMLKDIKNPEERLCSVELVIRKSWKFKWDAANSKVIKQDVLSGCIGGVFTYKGHRGKGLAKIMIDKLIELSKAKYLGADGFIFLYSEVGEYYARNGFKSFAVPLTHIPLNVPSSSLESFDSIVDKDTDKIELIKYHDFNSLFEVYEKHFKQKVSEKVLEDHTTRVAVKPTSDLVDWFHLRSKYFSYKLFHQSPEIDFINETYESIIEKFDNIDPYYYGIKLTNMSGELIGFITWTYDWSKKDSNYEHYVTILKIFINSKFDYYSNSVKLINFLKSYLEDASINGPKSISNPTKIVIWESEISKELHKYLVNEFGSKWGIENGSRSAILINNDNENHQLINGNLIWEGNDKLPWF